jgi:hypothetical protein
MFRHIVPVTFLVDEAAAAAGAQSAVIMFMRTCTLAKGAANNKTGNQMLTANRANGEQSDDHSADKALRQSRLFARIRAIHGIVI